MAIGLGTAALITGVLSIGGDIIKSVSSKKAQEERMQQIEEGRQEQKEWAEKVRKDELKQRRWQNETEETQFEEEQARYRDQSRRQRAEDITQRLNQSLAQNENMKDKVLSRIT